MNAVSIRIKMFGIHSLFFSVLLGVNCDSSAQKSGIPYGIYTNSNGNLSLNFRDHSLLTMEYPGYDLKTSYLTVQKENSQEIQITFKLDNKTSIAEYYIERDSSIYLMYFKSKKHISHHIDEIGRFYRNGVILSEPVNCSSIILDTLQTGEYFVHFDNTLRINTHECDTIYISQPGLTRVLANIDLRNLDHIQVFSSTGEGIGLCNSVADNKAYCIDILGFNQKSRSEIDERFNQKLEGDVLMFNISEITSSDH